MKPAFVTYAHVFHALQDLGYGEKRIEVMLKTGSECIPPHPCRLVKHRRWLATAVDRYVKTVLDVRRQSGTFAQPEGKGAQSANSH